MRHRGMLLCAMISVVGLAGGVCWAATTEKADDSGKATEQKIGPAPAAQPRVDLPTEKVGPGAPAGGAKTAAEAAKTPADSNAAGKKPGTTQGTSKVDSTNPMLIYGVLLGGFVLLYFWMGRSRRKQEAKRKEMLSNLKKNDKIVTIGGIIGTVVEAKPDEITIKVDESSNVRMKFARWAVRGVGEEGRQEPENKK